MVNQSRHNKDMTTETENVVCSIEQVEPAEPAASSFVGDERGQISVMVVLCLIPFIFLVAFIFNTARQTSHKIEMQGAADSAAVASAVTMARGMNFMVLNNNSMADVLSLMIFVRSMSNTATIFFYLNQAGIGIPIIGFYFAEAMALWAIQRSIWGAIDGALNTEYSGAGWQIMRALDKFNQLIKSAFPFWAIYQAAAYAHKNTANQFPYGFVLPGASGAPSAQIGGLSIQPPLPTFPVSRGPKQTIAVRAQSCQFGLVHMLGGLLFLLGGLDPYQVAAAELTYILLVEANFVVLAGGSSFIDGIVNAIRGSFGGIFDHALDFLGPLDFIGDFVEGIVGAVFSALGDLLGIKLLTWSSSESQNPRPMLLSEDPSRDTTEERNAEASDQLRRYLQFLGFALGKVPRGSPIGGERFLNQPNAFFQIQFTYGQADVYNPSKWDMWTQDWRAQLTRSKLFNEKLDSMMQILSGVGGADNSGDFDLNWAFVNTH